MDAAAARSRKTLDLLPRAMAFAVVSLVALSAGVSSLAGEPQRAGSASGAQAGDKGCKAFAWPVAQERVWFADKNLRRGASGLRLSRIDRAVELALQPTRTVRFFLPPRSLPPADTYSGDVTFFGVPHPGVYQVTISHDASIDVFENGTRLSPLAVSESKDCDGVRKSERFALAPGDLVLVQVSGATKPSINVAFEASPLSEDASAAAPPRSGAGNGPKSVTTPPDSSRSP